MVWGSCCFPYSYPIFGGYSRYGYRGYCAPPIDTYAAGHYLNGTQRAMASIFYPYVFATPWGIGSYDTDTSPEDAAAMTQMMYDPYHLPQIRVQGAGGDASAAIDNAKQQGSVQGKQIILKNGYNYLVSNTANIIASADKHLKSSTITDEQKKELQEFKKKAEELQKKIEEFKKNSPNKTVDVAIGEMEALEAEYDALYKQIKEFNDKVTAGQNPNGNNGVDGNDGVNGNDGHDGNDGTPEVHDTESLKKAYDESVKQTIDDIMKNDKVSAEDKKKLEEKQKELEKAIEENKPYEELKKIYDELGEMITGIQDKIKKAEEAEEKQKEQAKKDLADKCEKLNENISTLLQEDISLVPKKDKKALKEAQKELQEAIAAGKSQEELNDIYTKINGIYTRIQHTSGALKQEATNIAEQISQAAKGADIDSSQEDIIYNNVKKLNSKNIMAFLHIWDRDFKKNHGDDRCVLETIFDEFRLNSDVKKELSTHILTAMEGYAKNNGIYNQVGSKIAAVRALCKDLGLFTRYAPIYAQFNEMFIAFKQALS